MEKMPISQSSYTTSSTLKSNASNVGFRDRLRNSIQQKVPPSKECVSGALAVVRSRKLSRDLILTDDGTNTLSPHRTTNEHEISSSTISINTSSPSLIGNNTALPPIDHSTNSQTPSYSRPTTASIASRYRKQTQSEDEQQILPSSPRSRFRASSSKSPSRKIEPNDTKNATTHRAASPRNRSRQEYRLESPSSQQKSEHFLDRSNTYSPQKDRSEEYGTTEDLPFAMNSPPTSPLSCVSQSDSLSPTGTASLPSIKLNKKNNLRAQKLRNPLSPRHVSNDEENQHAYQHHPLGQNEALSPYSSDRAITPLSPFRVQTSSDAVIESVNTSQQAFEIDPTSIYDSDEENMELLVDNFLQNPNQIRSLLVNQVRRLMSRYESVSEIATGNIRNVGFKQRSLDSMTLKCVETFIVALEKRDEKLAKDIAFAVNNVIATGRESYPVDLTGQDSNFAFDSRLGTMNLPPNNLPLDFLVDASSMDSMNASILSSTSFSRRGESNLYPGPLAFEDPKKFSVDCVVRSWEAALSDDEILFANVETKTLDAISNYIDTLTLNTSSIIGSNEFISPEVNSIVNDALHPIIPHVNRAFRNNTQTPELHPMALAAIGEYIDFVVSHPGKHSPVNESLQSTEHPLIAKVKSVANEFDEVDPKILASIGAFIDALASKKTYTGSREERSTLDMGARALMNQELYDDDPFMTDLKSSSSDSSSIKRIGVDAMTLTAIGNYIDALAATKQHSEALPDDSNPPGFDAPLPTTSNKESTNIANSEDFTDEDPLITRLRKMKEMNEQSTPRKTDDPSANYIKAPEASTCTNAKEDPLIERLRPASSEKSSFLDKLKSISFSQSNAYESPSSAVGIRQPIDPIDEVPTAQRLKRIKQLFDDRRSLIAKETNDESIFRSSVYESSDSFETMSESKREAIRDYIDMVNYKSHNKEMTHRDLISGEASSKEYDLESLIESITLKVSADVGSGKESILTDILSAPLMYGQAEKSQGSASCPYWHERKALMTNNAAEADTLTPHDSVQTHGSSEFESSTFEQEVSSFEDEDSYFLVEQARFGAFDNLRDSFLDSMQGRPLTPIVDATDEDSGTDRLSTIPDVSDEDDSMKRSLSCEKFKSSYSIQSHPETLGVLDLTRENTLSQSPEDSLLNCTTVDSTDPKDVDLLPLTLSNPSNPISSSKSDPSQDRNQSFYNERSQPDTSPYDQTQESLSLNCISSVDDKKQSTEISFDRQEGASNNQQELEQNMIIANHESIKNHFSKLETTSNDNPLEEPDKSKISINVQNGGSLNNFAKSSGDRNPVPSSPLALSNQTSLVDDSVHSLGTSLVRSYSSNDADCEKSKIDSPRGYGGQWEREDEKKSDDETWMGLTFDAAVRRLFPTLTGSMNTSNQTIECFARLIRFAFPFVKSKQPGAFVVALILSEAQKLRIPLNSVDRFLDASQTLLQQRESLNEVPEELQGSEGKQVLGFLVDLIAIAEEKYGVVEYVDCAPSSITPILTICTSDDEGIEIGLDEDIANVDIVGETKTKSRENAVLPVTPDDRTLNVNDVESLDVDLPLNLDEPNKSNIESQPQINGAPELSHKTISNIDNDINEYWQQRRNHHIDNRKMRAKKFRVLSSYSDGIHAESRSLISASTETRTSLGSYSQSMESEDNGWRRNRTAAMMSKRVDKSTSKFLDHSRAPNSINAVRAASSLLEEGGNFRSRSGLPLPQVWRQSYVQRTQHHNGYFDVDVHSLYDSCQLGRPVQPIDGKPWELRVVKQRFLHEQSLSFSRNWFGCVSIVNGNDLVKNKVCNIKSMEMPMKAEEWRKDWYKKKWAKPLPSTLSGSFSLESPHGQTGVIGPYAPPFASERSMDEDDDNTWEETPECGKLKVTILKPGERVSRVTPDLTSFLRRSRWRKKHFPQGTCPYK